MYVTNKAHPSLIKNEGRDTFLFVSGGSVWVLTLNINSVSHKSLTAPLNLTILLYSKHIVVNN